MKVQCNINKHTLLFEIEYVLCVNNAFYFLLYNPRLKQSFLHQIMFIVQHEYTGNILTKVSFINYLIYNCIRKRLNSSKNGMENVLK